MTEDGERLLDYARRIPMFEGRRPLYGSFSMPPDMSITTAGGIADLVSLAAHKLEGPKGAGALWIRRGTAIIPQMHGGSQERYRRAVGQQRCG